MMEELTRRELEVLGCIAAGYTYPRAAEHLGISLATLRMYVTRINRKTGTTKRGAGRSAHSALIATLAGYQLRLPDRHPAHEPGKKHCRQCDPARTR